MMTPLSVPLKYPLDAADAQRAVNRIAIWVALVRHKFSSDYGREWLETTLRHHLRDGESVNLATKAVEAADAGDALTDAALRDVGAELQAPLMHGQVPQPGHVQVVAYLQRAAKRAPHKRKQGRYGPHDHVMRDCGICILVMMACDEFGVLPTRDLDSTRDDRRASGISLVTAALAKRKINLAEGTVQNHIWFGVWGELMRIEAEGSIRRWFGLSGAL